MMIVRANDDGPANGGVSTSLTVHATRVVVAIAATSESLRVRMMMFILSC